MNMQEMFQRLTMTRALMLGFFFASLYYFFMFDNGGNLESSIAAAKADFDNQTKQLAELNIKLDKAHEYQRSASEMGEALNKLLAYIPENFRLQDFMKIVSEDAKLAGLNIVRVSEDSIMAKADKRPEFEELAVSVELQGTFAQQMTFLANLTKQKQIFIIERFNLQRDLTSAPTQDLDSAPTLTFSGSVHAYRYIGGKAKS